MYALKLDRLSRIIYDWENLLKISEKYGFALVCANDDINTVIANRKMVSRIKMSVSQNETERTCERLTMCWQSQEAYLYVTFISPGVFINYV